MAWLTPEEREENRLRDEEAQRHGYRSAYDRELAQRTAGLRQRLQDVHSRVSRADIETILEAKREGLL